MESNLILYMSDNGDVSIQVRYEDGTFWLTQKRMAELFNVSVNTINEHLKGGSINYRRKVFCMLDSLRFVILRSLFGSICLFVQSYSPLYSFTHKQIDHKNSLAI